ncbi:MAG: TerC family protein [Deltaproteobacteria bacterium]|nr:TerC family protein [Deltaproteobacteria bacterium]
MLIWSGFLLLVCGILALDLGVLNKQDHVIGFREALRWTGVWVTVSMLFLVAVYFLYEHHVGDLGLGAEPLTGANAAVLYLTGYLVEYSLSADNIFVIALIIAAFRVPRLYQHRVLFWGILGALVLRGVMIGAGTALIRQFSWMIYVFGGILLLSAAKMAVTQDDDSFDPNDSAIVRWAKRFYPIAPAMDGSKFFVTLGDGRRAMTPLFLVLLLIESTDVLFAVDSIPAVFAVTTDPFLVFTSNIFAIMGLRSLYFALAGMLGRFHHLKHSLVVLMAFIGVKMLASHHIHIAPVASLGVIAVILAAGVGASLAFPLSEEALARHQDRHGSGAQPAEPRLGQVDADAEDRPAVAGRDA